MEGLRSIGPDVLHTIGESSKMAFIAGPRQVGKTTFARSLLSESGASGLYFNWDIEDHRRLITRHPGDFWQRKLQPFTSVRPRIVLDEIHKFPRWKRFLKGLYDEHGRKAELLVTGSGRLDLYQCGGDSLFGRYELHRLHPFTVGELLAPDRRSTASPNDFWKRLQTAEIPKGSEEALALIERFSGFPEPLFAGSERTLRRWRNAHRTLVLREDLRDLTRIREIGVVDSLALLLPERVGSPISINGLREELGVNFMTVKGYLETFARLYYLFAVRPYAARLARTLRSAEKVYLFDPTDVSDAGARFENVVALHLRKLADAWTDRGDGDFDLRYVRDREKREVDFLLTESQKPYALIEAKLTAREVDPSLRYFADRLKSRYSVQVIRDPGGEAGARLIAGTIVAPASLLLSLV